MKEMNPLRRKLLCLLAAGLAVAGFAAAGCVAGSHKVISYYISPEGDDMNPGTERCPVRTVDRAHELAGADFGKKEIHFLFMDGVHYIDSTIRIVPEMSGTSGCPVVYEAVNEGKAVISGGMRLDLDWTPYERGIYMADAGSAGISADQLYINGKRKPMARFPNIVPGRNVFDCWVLSHSAEADPAQDIFNPERVASWKNPEGAFIHAMHKSLWGDLHWVVTGKDAEGNLVYEGGWQNNRPSPMHPVYRFIENVFEELDAPGEWYYDKDRSLLYYFPEEGENLEDATVEVVRLEGLVDVAGTEEQPVSHVRFRGLVFRHAARTFMKNREPLLRSDWTVWRGGAVRFAGTEDCSMEGCEFDQTGGNAVFVDGYNRRLLFSRCHIHGSGSSGIAFVGDPGAVRSPLFRYGPQDYGTLDRTRGPLTGSYPEDCRVENCLLTMTGRFEKQTAPVQISMSHNITVSRCSIYDVPRAGINISEGTFGGHVIEYCDVFNTVLETGDHGSFNSWGRDRFWSPDINTTCIEVEKDTSLVWLDMLDPVIIRNSRWRCDHGWDIDLDDGSSHYRIYDNLLLGGGLKLREGYDRTVTNNIIVNNTLHPHVWYRNSGDVFMHNVVFASYAQIGMNVCIPDDGKWGKKMDFNLFVAPDSERTAFLGNGCDSSSVSGLPEFYDAASGDFRIREGALLSASGFRNFRMDEFGVTDPDLKRIAKTPEIPQLAVSAGQTAAELVQWNGAAVKNVETLGEMSAAGLGDACGVLVVSVTDNTPLAYCGLKAGDVILEICGREVCSVKDLGTPGADSIPDDFTVTVWRNQSEVTLPQ